jgi:hypothetical protein
MVISPFPVRAFVAKQAIPPELRLWIHQLDEWIGYLRLRKNSIRRFSAQLT